MAEEANIGLLSVSAVSLLGRDKIHGAKGSAESRKELPVK